MGLNKDFIERTAKAIRSMKCKPDALLFCGEQEVWDENTICGIPVFHSVHVINTMTDEDVPLIPLWKSEGDYSLDRKRFNDAFSE